MLFLAAGKKVGVTSNSHKAVVNLLGACGDAAQENGSTAASDLKVGDEPDKALILSESGLDLC